MAAVSYRDEDIGIVSEIHDYFDAARRERQPRVDNWKRNYRLVHNQPWGYGRSQTPWQQSPSVSEVYPIVASIVAWMTDQRTALSVIPAMNPHSPTHAFFSTLARDLELTLKSNWITSTNDREVEKGLWDALMYSIAFWKVTWDNAKAGGLGDADFVRVDPFRMYVDPQAHSFDDANYIIEARTMSMQELERRWPGSNAKLRGETNVGGGLLDERDKLYNTTNRPPMANPGGVDGAPPLWGMPGKGREAGRADREDDSIDVYEAWLRKNDHYTNEDGDIYVEDCWRVVVIAGNCVLMDEDAKDLWDHGLHPYTRYVPDEIGEFYGIALVDHLAPLQTAINRTLGNVQMNADLIGNPIFIEDSRAGVGRTTVANKAGQRLQKRPGSEVDWLRPPEMPTYIGELIKFYIGEMERVSGLSAIVRGATPTGRNAEGVMDSVQEAAFVRIRKSLRNLEFTIREAGELIASLICEFYTQPRLVAIVGPNDERSTLALKARHFMVPTEEGAVPMRFQLWVQAGSSLPISRMARSAEADVLFAMGALDVQGVLEAHEYPNRDQILQRIQQQQAAGMFEPPGARSATRGPTA